MNDCEQTLSSLESELLTKLLSRAETGNNGDSIRSAAEFLSDTQATGASLNLWYDVFESSVTLEHRIALLYVLHESFITPPRGEAVVIAAAPLLESAVFPLLSVDKRLYESEENLMTIRGLLEMWRRDRTLFAAFVDFVDGLLPNFPTSLRHLPPPPPRSTVLPAGPAVDTAYIETILSLVRTLSDAANRAAAVSAANSLERRAPANSTDEAHREDSATAVTLRAQGGDWRGLGGEAATVSECVNRASLFVRKAEVSARVISGAVSQAYEQICAGTGY